MNEHNYNINIERSVLSSILFEPKQFDELSIILKKDDFYLPAHQEIYSVLLLLNTNDEPIDEEFIKKELLKVKKFDEQVMLEILSTNPVSSANIHSYVKEIRKNSINRQIKKLSLKLQSESDLEIIDKLQILKDRFLGVDGERKLKKENFNNIFDKYDINFERIENVKFEYLIENFIVKNETTMISGRPGVGKSLLTVALANMLLVDKLIDQVFYIDGDNSISTLKDRNIHQLKKQHGNKFRYFVNLNRKQIIEMTNTLQKMFLTGSLIVFDNIKIIITGDRDKNKDVSFAMEILKTLRNNGASVIFLHHQNKKQKDFESDYAGSSAFAEDTSNAFTLTRNDDNKALILKPFKARSGELHGLAFVYNSINHTLSKLDWQDAQQTKEMQEMVNETIEFLKSSRNRPMWSELWKNLTEGGYDKEKASKVIKNGEGKLWNFERGDRNNQKLYSLIKTKVVEIVDEEIQNIIPITQITPRTPIQGSFKNLLSNVDKPEKSEKSIESNLNEG